MLCGTLQRSWCPVSSSEGNNFIHVVHLTSDPPSPRSVIGPALISWLASAVRLVGVEVYWHLVGPPGWFPLEVFSFFLLEEVPWGPTHSSLQWYVSHLWIWGTRRSHYMSRLACHRKDGWIQIRWCIFLNDVPFIGYFMAHFISPSSHFVVISAYLFVIQVFLLGSWVTNVNLTLIKIMLLVTLHYLLVSLLLLWLFSLSPLFCLSSLSRKGEGKGTK